MKKPEKRDFIARGAQQRAVIWVHHDRRISLESAARRSVELGQDNEGLCVPAIARDFREQSRAARQQWLSKGARLERERNFEMALS